MWWSGYLSCGGIGEFGVGVVCASGVYVVVCFRLFVGLGLLGYFKGLILLGVLSWVSVFWLHRWRLGVRCFCGVVFVVVR